MKNLLLNIIFILSAVVITAQETTTTNFEQDKENAYYQQNHTKTSTLVTKENISIQVDRVCYGEISKVAYYEALISQNGFDINLKNSADLVIRNTEEIISDKKDMISYSVNDQ